MNYNYSMNFIESSIIITWVLLNNLAIPIQSHENTTARCEICLQLGIKIPEQC